MVEDDKMLENGHLFEGLYSVLSCSNVRINLKLVFKTYLYLMIHFEHNMYQFAEQIPFK